ncbi:isocitrate lyase/phosphoenolpyruvate mutase family protein [Streptomyces sp. A1277]|uniref:isocitrate lyase/phosphoenolpyruvate mutase family protein n=1 Tax=Streptomyces sp. A1277 TaxID=2563103 RepID=UPI0010A27377|nr:isocitrate lyase/phosphoenolpyruvate mutase family protein [Streptomyces sp. A1277]THA34345.1 isocitrate lyase/phosphoenolpyruvate mutase family protein [Streptomyces sp. A1277]
MSHATSHEFSRYAEVRAALADPALVPGPPDPCDGPPGASVAWLRATVARFASGEPHRRRRALVEAELARLDPAELHRAATTAGRGSGLRTRVVCGLAAALDMPEPERIAQDVAVVADAYFGDAGAAHGAGCAGSGDAPSAGRTAAAPADQAVARLVALLTPGTTDEAGPEAVANRIGLLVQACAATATLVEAVTAAGPGVPTARVLREDPPVRTMRRVAARATRVAGREIAEGDVVLLDLVAAQHGRPVPLTFGAPPRVCPGRAHALALADGLLGRPLTPFARLHHRGGALLLPNAWDHASAAALVAEGFEAVGTTSLGVAAGLGLPDGAAATKEATVDLARRLGRGSFLFSVDAEGGFSDDPAEVAVLARRLYEAGAAGINLEDGRPDGTLAPVELHAAKIAAVKAAAPGLFVNARTDTYWLGRERERTADRLAVYEQAGADGVFVPGLSDRAGIAALTAALVTPLNVLFSPAGPGLAELGALGVRRVSLGSLLYREALAGAAATAAAIRAGRAVDRGALSYAEVQALAPGAASGGRGGDDVDDG